MPPIYAMKSAAPKPKTAEKTATKTAVWEYETGVQGLVKHLPSGRYYTRLMVGGKRKMIALKTDVWSTAKLRNAQELADAEKQRQSHRRLEAGNGTMGDLMRRYRDEYLANTALAERSKRLTEDTLKRLSRNWEACFGADLAAAKPGRMTLEQVRRFSNYLHKEARHRSNNQTNEKQGYSGVTVNKTLELLHRLMRLGVETGVLAYLPFELNPVLGGSIRKPEEQKKVRLPSSEQMRRIFAEMRKAGDLMEGQGEELKEYVRNKCEESAELAEFMAYSGARVGEATAFRWEDESKDSLIIRGTKTESSRDRDVPKIPAMIDLLAKMKKRRKAMGQKLTGLAFGIKQCRQCLAEACGRVGTDRLTHHALRHYFATVCIESGVDVPTVSRWLGHADGGSLAMRIYGHLRRQHSFVVAQAVRV